MQPMNNLGYLIHHMATALSLQSDQILREQLGIGMSQLKIMMILEASPHIRQRRIADALGQTEASISRQVKLLHEKGLIITEVSPVSRREHITTLTTKGARLTEEAFKVLNRHNAPMFARLSEKQYAQLIEILGGMHAYLCRPGRLGACDHPLT